MLNTLEISPPFCSLGDALDRLIRPTVGFQNPDDVIKDPDLNFAEKRSILASWASDACAVDGRPDLRWLLGSPEPVPLFEVLDAIRRLERRSEGRAGSPNSATGHHNLAPAVC
jgi:hypothetical protein